MAAGSTRNIDDDRIADQTVNCIEQDVLADGIGIKVHLIVSWIEVE
jgi:hypothetical protein